MVYLLLGMGDDCTADPTKECQILQTTDPRTPCYILIRQSSVQVPSFLYMLNIPKASEDFPCPASQTLDPTLTCYQSYPGPDPPAFILNVPLPPNADELDESPAGKLILRESKANPIFKPLNSGINKFQPRRTGPNSRNLGPPSPNLTMAVFKPLAPPPEFKEAPFISAPPPQDSSAVLRVPQSYQTKYHIIHYTSQPQTRPPYQRRELSSSGTYFPYLSGGGSDSGRSFTSPYPPSF